MKPKLYIIKIGGNVINHAQKLNDFLIQFAQIKEVKILIHGGGAKATELSNQLGLKTHMHEGRRITSKENLEVVTMVYAGLLNKQICAMLQRKGCNALGLSGADANTLQAQKRPAQPVDFGYVGDIRDVNTEIIQQFLAQNLTPVFCALTHDGQGQLLNTNADTIAAEIAIALSTYYTTTLIYCFEKKGVLADIHDENSVIPLLKNKTYQRLKRQGIIHAGMLPKLDNGFYALAHQVNDVLIGHTEILQTPQPPCTRLAL